MTIRRSVRRVRRPHATSRSVERLEPRHALAVTFTGGVWTIIGDADPAHPDDVIVIERNPLNARQLRATVGGVVVDVRSAARVKSVHVVGGLGDDTISVNVPGANTLATTLEGGFGNDTISGGDGPDTILGGPGRDTLGGGAGDDEIRGNGGSDSLVGSSGDDRLLGGCGIDTLRGGAGTNTLDGGLAIDAMYGIAGVDTARLDDGERLVGNESTNPLSPVDNLARVKAWAIDAAVARWQNQLGKEAWSWWGGPVPIMIDDSGWGMAHGTMATAGVTGSAASDFATPGSGFSQTPTQVAGVDEGDRIKTDGTRLYVIAGDGIDIVDVANPGQLAVASHLALPGVEQQLFLSGSRLTVISQENEATVMPYGGGIAGTIGWQAAVSAVVVTVIDVADATKPFVLETTRLDGWLVDARAVGDRVVVVTQDSLALPAPEVVASPPALQLAPRMTLTPVASASTVVAWPLRPFDPGRAVYEDEASYRRRLEQTWEASLPRYEVSAAIGGESSGTLVAPGHTWLPVDGGDTSLLSVSSFAVADDHAGPDTTSTAAGVGGRVVCSLSSLYVVDTHMGNWWDAADAGTTTNLYQFDLGAADLPLVAMGSVAGATLDQFSIDEEGGLLRIATTEGFGDASSNRVSVLAAVAGHLEAIGSVSGLAPGERITSVRFIGSRGYVTTFRQIDPLFVIDLANPTAPRVAGELKVPGFSTALVPLDETHLLGVGRDVDPVTGGDTGLQLSIFDVGDPANPMRTATFGFGGSWGSWSPASWDHHALGWFAKQGILALPVQQGGWQTDLVVFRVDPASSDAFTRLGSITHADSIDRSLRIGHVLYAVSPGQVTSHPIDDPTRQLAAADLTPGPWSGGPIVVSVMPPLPTIVVD